MKKTYLISIISFLIGIGCFITYSIIGSNIALDGTLVEPFFLIPIGRLFILIGIISSVVFLILNIVHGTKNK